MKSFRIPHPFVINVKKVFITFWGKKSGASLTLHL